MSEPNLSDKLARIEWLIIRVALLLLLLIGIVKVIKVELSSLW